MANGKWQMAKSQEPRAKSQEPIPMTRAMLLSIGDELLLGEIVDTNRPYIAQRLLTLGISVAGAETVGDESGGYRPGFFRGRLSARRPGHRHRRTGPHRRRLDGGGAG